MPTKQAQQKPRNRSREKRTRRPVMQQSQDRRFAQTNEHGKVALKMPYDGSILGHH